jgi:hypothetical protein
LKILGLAEHTEWAAGQHDTYSVAAWLRQADLDGQLARFLNPQLTPPQRTVAQVEGWILGIG